MSGAKRGRVEGRIVVPTGGWDVTLDDSTIPATVSTVPAGTYSPTSLAAALQTALTATGGTYAVTLSAGESGTGLVTITCSSGSPFSITWDDTDLRDAVGFTANIVAAATPQTGVAQMKALWLPPVPKRSQYGDAVVADGGGTLETDYTSTVGPTGRVYALKSTSYTQHERIAWEGVVLERALEAHETTANASWECFARDCAWGRLTYIPVNSQVDYYPDADSSSKATGRLLWPRRWELMPVRQNWIGLWLVELPTLVVEGS